MKKAEPSENPLISNKKLRQIYATMLGARMLDERIVQLPRGAKTGQRWDSVRGQEASRVSTAIDLIEGDLVSDSQAHLVTNLVLGEKIGSLLRRAVHGVKRQRKRPNGSKIRTAAQLLPPVEDGAERLRIAMGAALSLKTAKNSSIVVTYVGQGDLKVGAWKKILGLAAKLELPIIFVVLPISSKKKGKRAANALVYDKARACGVPGIPVDSADAVALYRVAQESIGRTRGGDGPVLIECIHYDIKKKRGQGPDDPIVLMKKFLLNKGVCDEQWFNRESGVLQRQMERVEP
jgi:TPP-dependent pyruvate/acetoin dehydrogenase alpha subunit